MSDFIARQRIPANGGYVTAYQPGDLVTAQVVTDWDLTIGEQVTPSDGYTAPRPADDDQNRTAWEAYVTGQGTTIDDARAASLDDLRGMYDAPKTEPGAHDLPATVAPEGVDGTGVRPDPAIPPADDQGNTTPAGTGPERPAASAKKADWVEYAVAAGADADWARADDTTKADLESWKP